MREDKPAVEDRIDIEELFANYGWALNTGDGDGYIACFTEDGWVDHKPQGRCQGREAMLSLLNQIWHGMPYSYLGRQHQAHNFVMRHDGENIRVRACWTINRLEQSTNTFYLYLQGHWDALCSKEHGEWKFRELTVVHWFRETAPWVGDPKVRLKRELDWG